MKSKFPSGVRVALAGAILASTAALFPSTASAVVLPAANCGLGPTNNCLTFGDFNVFSLPLLQLRATGSSVPGPGDAFYAPSTYGAIKNDTIIGINNGNYTNTGNPAGFIDGSFNTPSPNNTTSQTFSTRIGVGGDTAKDPYSGGGPPNQPFISEFLGDANGSWDARKSSLLGLSGGLPLTFYFAFNETGAGTGLETTDLLIWGMAKLVDDQSGDSRYFYLGGKTGLSGDFNSGYTPLDDGVPPAAGPDYGPWVYVHAGICADAAGNFLGFPDSSGNCAAGAVRNQNNLGQNAAAFMVNSPDFDAALADDKWDAVQITWEMAYINGGGETAWIMPTATVNDCATDPRPECFPIPEPNGLALLGLAIVVLAGVSRSRKEKTDA